MVRYLMTKMVAIFLGDIALCFGVALLLIPLLITELSRPRDAWWGAVFLLWGLNLITNNDRFEGSEMFAIGLASLLIYRFLLEASQNRWHQLTQEEKTSLGSLGRWKASFSQLILSMKTLGSSSFLEFKPLKFNLGKPKSSKKWIRKDQPESEDLQEGKADIAPPSDS